jgi:hypothetical protein
MKVKSSQIRIFHTKKMFNNLKAKLQEATASGKQPLANVLGNAGSSATKPSPSSHGKSSATSDFLDDDDELDRQSNVLAEKPASSSFTASNADRLSVSGSLQRHPDEGSGLDLSDVSSAKKSNKLRQQQQQLTAQSKSDRSNSDQLNQKFDQLEAIVRDITPLDGLSDLEAFANHLRGLIQQKSASMQEIMRLSHVSEGMHFKMQS